MTPYELFAGALTVLGGISVGYAGYAKHRFDRRFASQSSTQAAPHDALAEAERAVEQARKEREAATVLMEQARAMARNLASTGSSRQTAPPRVRKPLARKA
jgi:truncated hemoglobin YjbI